MTTKWGRQRKAAREAGAYAAHGGPDRRREFDGIGVVHSYDEGYKAEIEEMQVAKDRAERLAPLEQINNQADALAMRSDNEEVRGLADMIRDLTQYLMEKDSG